MVRDLRNWKRRNLKHSALLRSGSEKCCSSGELRANPVRWTLESWRKLAKIEQASFDGHSGWPILTHVSTPGRALNFETFSKAFRSATKLDLIFQRLFKA